MKTFRSFLNEKLIVYNNGAPYGQVVFLVGGAGSGKDFSILKLIDSSSYHIFDVDKTKQEFLDLNRLTQAYPELLNINQKNPEDATRLHQLVKDIDLDGRLKAIFFADRKDARTLPNVMFNISGKDIKDITQLLPTLLGVGYQPRNIHITWVLTNYETARANNSERSRVAPEDLLAQTHMGAFGTMYQIVRGELPHGVDGSVTVILNNRENTVFYAGSQTVKDFTYVVLKQPGRSLDPESEAAAKVIGWALDNVPRQSPVPV